MHYSNRPNHVMCDVFKPSGKWYERIELEMPMEHYGLTLNPFDAVVLAIVDAGHYPLGKWIFYVPEPYHTHAYPVMIPAENSADQMVADAKKGMEYMRKQERNART